MLPTIYIHTHREPKFNLQHGSVDRLGYEGNQTTEQRATAEQARK